MTDSGQKPTRWWEGVRRIGESLLALARGRFELFAVELQKEKLRLVRLLLVVSIALLIGAAGVLIALAALSLFLWELAGYWGLIGLALGSILVAGGILVWLRGRVRTEPLPFAQTIAEFRKDQECFRDGTNP